MNIYLVSQTEYQGYDMFTDFVCAANSASEAKRMMPHLNGIKHKPIILAKRQAYTESDWATNSKNIHVKMIGTCKRKTPTIFCSSYNAG